jgi:serine/threonine protein kinase
VLIDEDGTPRLCDFGLSRMMVDTSLWHTSARTAPGTFRWKAPELLSGEQLRVTTQSDMYAFGMTCLVSHQFLNVVSPLLKRFCLLCCLI